MIASRTKALAFAAILLIVSLGFVTAAATSATSALAPLRNGEAFALERPLTRHGTVLAVLVGHTVEGEPKRSPDATVTVTRTDVPSPRLVGTMQTDENGRAVFYIAKGTYRVDVLAGTSTASHDFTVHQPMRVSVLFDDSGAATWNAVDHKRLERRGDTHTLVARVVHPGDGGRTPVAGVTIEIYEVKGDVRTSVDQGTTGPRGNAAFVLPKGRYDVVATSQGSTASQVVRLGGDALALFVEDADGLHAANPGRPAARAR